MKIKEKRLGAGMSRAKLSNLIGTSPMMISRFEEYKCLPIPCMMDKLTEVFECSVEDLYEDFEISYKKSGKKKGGGSSLKNSESVYKLTVRLPGKARTEMREMLDVCGYKDVTYWIWRCYERLVKQYEILKRKEKKPKSLNSWIKPGFSEDGKNISHPYDNTISKDCQGDVEQ